MRALPRGFALMGRARDLGLPAPQGRGNQLAGIALLLAAIFTFTLMDGVAKYLGERYAPAQVVWARFTGNLLILLLIFRAKAIPMMRSRQPGLQLARAVLGMLSAALFFASLPHIGLAEATAIMDLNPVLITLGAAVFLGEKIGWRRALGIAAAFAGALIIIRPGMGVFHPAALLPLIGAFTYAGNALLTRALRFDATTTSLMWSAVVGTAITSAVVPFFWQPIAPEHLWAFIIIGALGAISQAMLVRAFTLAEAAAIAPFGYTGLIWAGLWGFLFWGIIPDLWTFIGAAIIVLSGLYVWAREAAQMRKAERETARGPAR